MRRGKPSDRVLLEHIREGVGRVQSYTCHGQASCEETAYLLRAPANARRLLESIAELEAGKGSERELIE